MDTPFTLKDWTESHRARGPLTPWIPLALIVVVLTSAAAAASAVPDTRDVRARHHSTGLIRAL